MPRQGIPVARQVFRRDSRFHSCYRTRPEIRRSVLLRAHLCYGTGDFDKAIADCTEAIKLDPKHVLAYYTSGAAHFAKGDCDAAIADFTQAIRLGAKAGNTRRTLANHAQAYYARACAYEEKGQRTKAEADFAEARRLRLNADGEAPLR